MFDLRKTEILEKNGWKLKKTINGGFLLEINPTLEKPGAVYKVSQEVFEEGKKEEIGLQDIIKKFNLFTNFEKLSSPRLIKLPKKENTPTKFYGGGFIVEQEQNKYFLHYQLARHGGGSRKFEISKEIYEEARTGKYSTSDLFKKYDLYHLDVPENDVK